MNKAGVKSKRVLGFVDLSPCQWVPWSFVLTRYLNIVSSMPSLFWSNRALNQAKNDG